MLGPSASSHSYPKAQEMLEYPKTTLFFEAPGRGECKALEAGKLRMFLLKADTLSMLAMQNYRPPYTQVANPIHVQVQNL